MNIKGFLEKQRLKIMNNRKITLSGEINILTSNIREVIITNDDLFMEINSYANILNTLYPYLKIESIRELHEITIKLFAYNENFSDENFFDGFQENLKNLLYSINKLSELNVKLNVYGEISTLSKIDKFRFINNRGEVYYKITDVILKNELSKTFEKLIEKIFAR